MKVQPINYDAIVRAAHVQRSRAIGRFWRKLAENLSPRMPKILQYDE